MRRPKRTSVEIHHAGGTFPAKKLFGIVAGILAIDVEWTDGFESSAVREAHAQLAGESSIDCGFAAEGASFDVYAEDRSYALGPKENARAYFAFRLLSKLQSLATIPAVDWLAYANQLSKPQFFS